MMKTHFKSTIVAGFILATAAMALAAPRSKQQTMVQPGADQENGAKIAYTCNQCMGAGEQGGMAMMRMHGSMGNHGTMGMNNADVCKTGDTVQCSSCTMSPKITAKGRPAAKVASHKSVLTNGKGETCEFHAIAPGSE